MLDFVDDLSSRVGRCQCGFGEVRVCASFNGLQNV